MKNEKEIVVSREWLEKLIELADDYDKGMRLNITWHYLKGFIQSAKYLLK